MTEEADLLPKRGRGGFVSFDRKVLDYPKFILGLQHPPLTESNCKEFKILSEKAKGIAMQSSTNLRGCIPDTLRSSKLKPLVGLDFDEVSEVVDASIGLIKKLNTVLGVHGQDL